MMRHQGGGVKTRLLLHDLSESNAPLMPILSQICTKAGVLGCRSSTSRALGLEEAL